MHIRCVRVFACFCRIRERERGGGEEGREIYVVLAENTAKSSSLPIKRNASYRFPPAGRQVEVLTWSADDASAASGANKLLNTTTHTQVL